MIINEYASDYSIVTPSMLLDKVEQIDQEAIQYHFKQQKTKKFDTCTLSEATNLNKTLRRKTSKKKDALGLKRLIKQQKINNLVKRFAFKLKLNNVNSKPVEYSPFEQDYQQSLYDINGIQISDTSQKILSILIAVQIIICVFVDTTAVIFPEILQKQAIKIFQFLSILIFSIELVTSCIAVKLVQGKKIQKIRAIITNYVHDGMLIDVAYMIVLIAGMIGDFHYFRLIILLKLPQCFHRIQKLQNLLVNTFYKEQYWGLTKVFLLNFALAHFLSLILVFMSNLNNNNNWMIKFNINQRYWFQKYVWGYYWGTTIMLTVGFGDITAANYQQAICLVLIQTFSCLALAYNINCVGNLIANIKSQDIQKNRNIKTFKLLSNRNNISEDLQIKIHNYIQQSTNIKKKFNFAEEHNFISTLPPQIKADFLKESNKKIFQNLLFIKNLTQKTLLAFSEVIQMKICHPQQIIKKRGELSGLMILKQGKLGYCTKINGSQFNNITIEKICINQNQKPFLVSLDFISMERCNYQVKSEEYSIIYLLDRQKTIQTLKVGELDYEHYCFLRDRAKNLTTQFQVLNCQFCNYNHTKFDCPKLHYTPLKKHVIDKYLHHVKVLKNQRFPYYQREKKKTHAFKQVIHNIKLFQVNQKVNQKYVTWRRNKRLQSRFSVDHNAIFETGPHLNSSKNKPMLSLKSIKPSSMQTDSFQLDQQKKQELHYMANLIKDQFLQVINKKQQVWQLQCDQVKNFKFYFLSFNANKLQGDRTASLKNSFI